MTTTASSNARAGARATSSDGCIVHVVRGGEDIAAPEFVRPPKKKAA